MVCEFGLVGLGGKACAGMSMTVTQKEKGN